MTRLSNHQLRRRIDAAQGKILCDLVLKNVLFLDVFSCQWVQGDLAICDGMIVGFEPGLKGKRTKDFKGSYVVPGFIDAHVHVESSLLVPQNFQKAVLPRGTTTAICDPHELANVQGAKGIKFFLDQAEDLDLDLRVMLSSCVPATNFETNGAGAIEATQLAKLAKHPKALGLAEMMNVPGVLSGNRKILDKLSVFSEGPIDGHCPLVTGKALSAYAAAGISSCHESSNLKEAREKLLNGISCWIREGSVAKDLQALIPLLNIATSTSIGFCTDDRNPLDIVREGHIDHLVREAIRCGVAPEIVYRSSSWSVARHYGLERIGAIAPGYVADLVVLDEASSCSIRSVLKGGRFADEVETKTVKSARVENSIRALRPSENDFSAPKGQVNVIGVRQGKILTEHLQMNSDDPGVAQLTVIERHGKKTKPANGYVFGFGVGFKGAIASSVGHDSHNLIVAGSNPKDMAAAICALIECGGGFCVVQNSKVLASLELPFGGLMSFEDPKFVTKKLLELHKASHYIGCELPEPFLQLAFLSLPVIPSLKLTNKGLVDVNRFQLINVRVG